MRPSVTSSYSAFSSKSFRWSRREKSELSPRLSTGRLISCLKRPFVISRPARAVEKNGGTQVLHSGEGPLFPFARDFLSLFSLSSQRFVGWSSVGRTLPKHQSLTAALTRNYQQPWKGQRLQDKERALSCAVSTLNEAKTRVRLLLSSWRHPILQMGARFSI